MMACIVLLWLRGLWLVFWLLLVFTIILLFGLLFLLLLFRLLLLLYGLFLELSPNVGFVSHDCALEGRIHFRSIPLGDAVLVHEKLCAIHARTPQSGNVASNPRSPSESNLRGPEQFSGAYALNSSTAAASSARMAFSTP